MNFEEHEFIREVQKNIGDRSFFHRFPNLRAMWNYGRLVEQDNTIKDFMKNLINSYVEAFARAGGSRYPELHQILLVDAVIQSHDLREHFAKKTADLISRCPNWEWCQKASTALFELYQHLLVTPNGGREVARQIASSSTIKEVLRDTLRRLGVPQQGREQEALQLTLNSLYSVAIGRGYQSIFNVINEPGIITVMEPKGVWPFKKLVPVQKTITRTTRVVKPVDQIISEYGF